MPTSPTENPTVITIDVTGIAQPKGSMKAFNIPGLKAPVVTSANPKLKDWQQSVTRAAGLSCRSPVDWPISMALAFRLPRPKSRKKDVHHLTKPDLDKLIRAINDALTAVAYRDDSQVVAIHAMKRYCRNDETPGVRITLEGIYG